ncbi:transcriptional regulator [Staphylococcus nepalensis]|uniref:XRE family transcriptional regulator n=1 Tax=Staphylococcus TaxID=1279 RepID=UPI000BC2C69C|nr:MULTISPECIES: S24 family peptidase [Staphylococcus]ATH60417.1 transcriptional regulator [Staphylococcus nepalensis]ATH61469.1 transcriptional regulator [Staphylococcus nepalensis]ATH65466.1 transcriptional regulator [Staphylococcus nepalensis]NWN86119.1 helix-turn-helix transcriptional regulator [Staphylococcus sp.]
MNSFKDRLKFAMQNKNLNQSELSKLTGIGRNSISDYLKGKYEAKQDKIYILAKYLNVNEAWLMGYDVSKERVSDEQRDVTKPTLTQINEVSSKLEEKRQKRVLAYAKHHYSVQQQGENIIYLQSYKDSKTEEVTVNGYVSAGTGETLVDDIKFIVNYPAGVVPPHDFALQINGDSMEPLFEHKEIIFVEENTSINSGQLGVFVVDGEAYVKKVFIYQDHIRLVSLNPKYGDMNFYGDSDVRFAGRVIL